MTTDLLCLLILALWTLPLNHIPAIGRVSKAGIEWAMTNRDSQPEVPLWVGRADRAQRNHLDNLAMIASVILIAQVSGKADATTAIAAIVVVAARIAHSLTYLAGLPLPRSLSYLVSVAALLVIVWRIFA